MGITADIIRCPPGDVREAVTAVRRGELDGDTLVDVFFLDTYDYTDAINRYWDRLLYLFSETRRGLDGITDESWRDYPETLAWAVAGASGLGIADDNGKEFRMCSPEQVRDVALALSASPPIRAPHAAIPPDQAIEQAEGYWFDQVTGFYLDQMELIRVRLGEFFAEAARRGEATIHHYG